MNQIPSEAASDVTQADAVAEAMREYHVAKLPDDFDGDKDKACWFDRHALTLLNIAATRKPDPSALVEALQVIAVGEGCMNDIREELSASALRKIAYAALSTWESPQ